MTTAQDGGKFVNLTHRPPLPPENTTGINLEEQSNPGPLGDRKDYVNEDFQWNQLGSNQRPSDL
jgi:hypothetical protein